MPTPRGNHSYRQEIQAINARARSLSARSFHPTAQSATQNQFEQLIRLSSIKQEQPPKNQR